uniref:Glycoside hydrolase family 3 C-terminal domain-containing protein n=1 Tax=Nelumbo nucifera TaxID=4432 RepID=A0A822XKP5_NELNU|nr:TPA_asm: hypothetical protein HUJ06_020848 [Nelumbo nucifera]
MEATKKADANVVVVGLDLSIEDEFVDHLDLLLLGYQTQLVNQDVSIAKGPIILVLMCSGSIDISFAKKNPNIGDILWAGYPTKEGGCAIANTVRV